MLEDVLRQDLAEQIRSAFADTPKPRKHRLGRTQDPPKSLVNKEWQAVTVDEVNSYSLSSFTREGLLYYAPAYLMAVTLHPDEVKQPLDILQAFTPPLNMSWDDQSFTIGAEFDIEQARVIGEFVELFDLLYREKLNPTNRDHDYFRLMRKAEFYWWYQQTRELRNEVIRIIEAAFAKVRCPEYLGDEWEVGHFVGKHWKELERWQFNVSLNWFTDAAFRFYLPGYLIDVLRYPSEAGLPLDSIFQTLAPTNSYWRKQGIKIGKKWSKEERAAVRMFFENIEQLSPLGLWIDRYDNRLEIALDYWRATADLP